MSLLSPPLEAFWAVVQKGTVQEASRTIGLTQTGVTQRIRSIEKMLNTTLFIRSRKGMKLTAEGESLLQYVKNSLENEGMTLSKIQGTNIDSIIEISITGPSSILRSRVIPKLSETHSKNKNLRYRFDLSDTENFAEGGQLTNSDKLKTGFCDLAILEHHDITKEMDSKILKAERYKLYVATSWKRRTFIDIITNESIIDFNSKDMMTFNYLDKYKLKSKAKKERHYANNTDALTSMIASGLGYSVLSEEYATPLIKKGELFDISPSQFFDFKIALAWYHRPHMPDYFRHITKTIV
jgi:LysR family transcriptional regulator, chromosome initiation inhibitor